PGRAVGSGHVPDCCRSPGLRGRAAGLCKEHHERWTAMKFDPKDLSFEFETKEEADAACDLAERIVFKGNVPLTGPEAPELIQTVNAALMGHEEYGHRLDGNPILYGAMVLPFRIMVGARRLDGFGREEPTKEPVGTPAPVLALMLLEETLE